MILAGYFNINALNYERNKKIQGFVDLMYQTWYNMIPTINKPSEKVGKKSATVIDNIIANCIVDCQFKTAILKTDVTELIGKMT